MWSCSLTGKTGTIIQYPQHLRKELFFTKLSGWKMPHNFKITESFHSSSEVPGGWWEQWTDWEPGQQRVSPALLTEAAGPLTWGFWASVYFSVTWVSLVRSGLPNLRDLMPHDLRWSWCSSNRNEMHNKRDALESSSNHSFPPWSVEKLSSARSVPGAKRVADPWRWSLAPPQLCSPISTSQVNMFICYLGQICSTFDVNESTVCRQGYQCV